MNRAVANERPDIAYQNPSNNNLNVKTILNPFFIEFDLKKSSLEGKNVRKFSVFLLNTISFCLDGVCFKIKSNNQFKSSFNCMIAWSINIENFYKELEKDIRGSLYNDDYLNSISAKIMKFEIIQEE